MMPRTMNNKYCVVCGDKATGYNFNALTCESCKAFFRRNALKKIPKCKFQSNCVIDIVMRRMCAFCRLNKCIECGMKKVSTRSPRIRGSTPNHLLTESTGTLGVDLERRGQGVSAHEN
ncbi:unnamed protein product [Oppiella nova]|uniref:Nuclear receptor domain-containing protein n=1 Tax=Oppiella nova TaxID=334625 RepID=A0A7R9QBD8_9ACAR|nr:unnamed protein product [Oppiella nova]CAG2162422.1 unnamed protein product [Oppiella nova]